MNTTLVVMAAGLGSRFGGLKQMEPITDDGRVILDFSVFDAVKAGFDKVVFILKKEMADDFKSIVGKRLEKMVDVEYVIQSTDELPQGRAKPFGTGHAILCCKDAVNTPFAVINADDYYGANAFKTIHDYLETSKGYDFSMVAYELGKTLSKNGSVARGVCEIENGYLKDVTERTKIENFFYEENGKKIKLPENSYVSMNLWGLTPDIFPVLEKEFDYFKNNANLEKDEFFLPFVINSMLKAGKATVKVLKNSDKWYGITYREDLDEIKNAMRAYIEKGLYNR